MKNYEKKPEVAYEFRYIYYYRKGKIFQVNLDFTDRTRRISIEGRDPTQVDALFSMLKEKFESKQSFFGGDVFRALLFFGIFILLMIYILLGAQISDKTGVKRLIPTGCILMVLGLLYWKFDLFQGTAIYSGDASFIVRNSAQIGFWGLLIGIVSLILPYFKKKKPKVSSPTLLTETPPPIQTPTALLPPPVEKTTKTENQTVEDAKDLAGERTPLELEVIYTKLKETPPAQVEEVARKYYGSWVRCTGTLGGVTKIKDKDLGKIYIGFQGGLISTTVSFSKYPELAFLPGQHPILIVGRLLEKGLTWELVDVELSYDFSVSEGKKTDTHQQNEEGRSK